MTSEPLTLVKVASAIGAKLILRTGQVSNKTAAETQPVAGVSTLATARENEIAFLANARYRQYLPQTRALAVIVDESSVEDCPVSCLVHDNPYYAYSQLTQLLDARPRIVSGIAPTAVVSAKASVGANPRIGPNVTIGDNVVIGANAEIGANVVIENGVTIGDDVVLRASVSLCHGVRLGDRVTVQSGSVIGADGFGYAPVFDSDLDSMSWSRIAQLGSVVVGDDVEIGAGTTVDRGALDDTTIGNNVIIDNQVQIAHNVTIGDGTAVAGCVGIAGSASIGRNCSIGGGAGIAGHLSIADNTTVLGMTLINRSIKQPGVYASGTGMQEATSWRKSAVRFTQLDDLAKRLLTLEQRLSNDNKKT